jgi:hypothetical protein
MDRLQIIFRSGRSVEFDAENVQLTRGSFGKLRKLEWTRREDWKVDVLYLSHSDVVAVVVMHADDASSPGEGA